MCWFITLAVDERNAEKVRALTSTISFHVAESTDTSACSLLKPELTKFLVTDGGCSCSIFQENTSSESDDLKKRAQLERKGWSKAKIERALAESCEAKARNAQKRNVAALRFRELVAAILDEGAQIQLYSHFYGGSVVSEQLSFPAHSRVTREQFLAGEFPADTVISVGVAG